MATFGPRCHVCGVVTEPANAHRCAMAGCPCFGTEPGTRVHAEIAAHYYESSGRAVPASVTVPARALDGGDALDIMDRAARLDAQRAYGDVLDVLIEHRDLP